MKMYYDLTTKQTDTLRDIPHKTSDMQAYVDDCIKNLSHGDLKKLSTEDKMTYAKNLGQLGSCLKTLGRLDEAQMYLVQSLEMIETNALGVELWVINHIRYADVIRYQGDWEFSLELLEEAVITCKTNSDAREYLDFAYQYLGRVYFDYEDYEMALDAFHQALKIRQQKNDKEMIDATEFAIAKVKEKVS